MKWWYRVYFGIAAGILLLFGLLILVMPQHRFSENENRTLTMLPKFHWTDFWSGEYQPELEKAVDDQVPGRDRFTALASLSQRLAGYRDVGGAYLAADDTLISKTTIDDIEQFRYMENLRYVEYLSEQCSEQLNLMLVPSAGTILSDQLPYQAPFYEAAPMYKAAKVVCSETQVLDLRKALRLQKDLLEEEDWNTSVYFRTDHHWTLPGAYQGYAAYMKAQNREPREYASFKPELVSEGFYGTLYSKVLDRSMKADVMYAASQVGNVKSVICDGKEQADIYDKKKLETKDKYAYFFGGNYGELRVQMDTESDRKLLVFKDSFANSMIPFFLQDYQEVIMIDLRYYRQSVAKLLEEEDDVEILVLYEMSNFATDANLFKLSK